MSIADIMAELESQDWKAGDKETDFSVPDGVYEGVIEGLEYKENEKGTQWFSFTVNLINENMFRINVGLTFNERWFAKFKVR